MSDNQKHPTHRTKISLDASSYDEICVNCGATDRIGSWGKLAEPCSKPSINVAKMQKTLLRKWRKAAKKRAEAQR